MIYNMAYAIQSYLDKTKIYVQYPYMCTSYREGSSYQKPLKHHQESLPLPFTCIVPPATIIMG